MLTIEQRAERKTGLGGSDAAIALGLSPWVTARELYEQKLDPELGAEATEGPLLWGHLLEPLIRQRYCDKTGRSVVVPDTLRHPKYPWMFAHLDGITNDGRGFEAKTARSADGWGEPGTDAVPQSYLIQVQHCMIVARLEVFDVCVLIGGSEERQYEVPADRELQELIVEQEAEFWSRVERRDPPDIDYEHRNVLDLLRKLYPGTTGEVLAADESLEAWRLVMEQSAQQATAYDENAKRARAHILAAMGEASVLRFADGKELRRKLVARKGYVVEPSSYIDARIVKGKE